MNGVGCGGCVMRSTQNRVERVEHRLLAAGQGCQEFEGVHGLFACGSWPGYTQRAQQRAITHLRQRDKGRAGAAHLLRGAEGISNHLQGEEQAVQGK